MSKMSRNKDAYLIRKNLEVIYGPVTLRELKSGFDRMEYSLQDEIAGPGSIWVFLENNKSLKRHYPEVHEHVYRNLKNWAQTSQNRIYDVPTKKLKARRNKDPIIKAIAAIVACLVLALAIYYGRNDLKDIFKGSGLSSEYGLRLLKEEKFKVLDEYMSKVFPGLVARQNSNELSKWMPLIRWYAFYGNGTLSGISAKALKGRGEALVPINCSVEAWSERFILSVPRWKLFFQKKQVIADEWLLMLSWNSNKVNRYRPPGWVNPRNYYAACITIASRVFYRLADEPQFIKLVKSQFKSDAEFMIFTLRNRLVWLSHKINKTIRPVYVFDKRHMDLMTKWSCLEHAEKLGDLANCHDLGEIESNDWNSYSNYRYNLSMVRLFMNRKSVNQSQLDKIDPKFLKYSRDPFNKMDIRPEVFFAKQLIKSRGNTGKSIQKLRSEFPNYRESR